MDRRDVDDLRTALNLSHQKFADRVGIHINTAKKWKKRGITITLEPFFADLVESMFNAATVEQRARFDQLQIQRTAAPGTIEIDPDPAIWTAPCEEVAHDLTRKDLTLDRRDASRALVGVVVGAYLLEPHNRPPTFVTAPPTRSNWCGSLRTGSGTP